MKTQGILIAAAMLFAMALSAFHPAHEANYKIAPGFIIKITGHDVEATFDSLQGNIRFAPEHLDNVRFDVTVASASISTGEELKDAHASSKKWLDVKAFPAIRYQSTNAKRVGDGFSTSGELELHGVKQGVEIPFQFTNNMFSGEFDIKRMDYGIGKAKSGIAPDIHISLKVPVVPVH